MSPADWTASSIATIALLLSIFSLAYSRRATKASERSAAVAERQEQARLAEAERTAVKWLDQCRWNPGTGALVGEYILTIRLENTGAAPARNVDVTLPAGVPTIGGSAIGGPVHPGLSFEVEAVPPRTVPSTPFEVSWQIEDGGQRYSRKFPWPAGPPRPEAHVF